MGHAFGARVQRVQKVQKVQRELVGGSAAIMNKNFKTALTGEGKPYNRAYGAGKCTPIPLRGLPPKGETTHYILRVADAPSKCVRCAPRRGKFALCPAFELISISKHSAANTSPSGVAKELDS